MKEVSKKVIFLAIMGAIIVSFIFFATYILNKYFELNRQVFYHLNVLQKEEYKLNYHILQSSIYMYYDNDTIAEDIKVIRKEIKDLEESEFFRKHFPDSYITLIEYEKLFDKKVNLIFEFQRFNMPLKNSIIYLSEVLKKMPYVVQDRYYLQNVVSIISSIFLTKQTIDVSFIDNIANYLDNIKHVHLNEEEKKLNNIFMNNLYIFFKYFPQYKSLLSEILFIPTTEKLNEVFITYNDTTKRDLKIFNFLSYLLALFIMIIIIYLIYSIYELENRIKDITYLLYHDKLTGLYNRKKFNEDLKEFKRPVLILFNIDRFKHINDFYGVEFGDIVLSFLGRNLLEFVKRCDVKAKVYRIGADDFAVVCDTHKDEKLISFAQEFIDYIENKPIEMGNHVTYNLSLSVGISKEKDALLETADIALKNVKKDLKNKIKFFESSLNEQIKENLKKTHELKWALENDKIVPYYQGIFDKDKNLVKYEVLARLITPRGEVKSIFPYLKIAMENRQYNHITFTILKKVKEALVHNSDLDVNVSINLSVEDISNKEVVDYILNKFLDKEIGPRVSFEILESEIENYEIIENFISKVKPYGVEFAIDDFGSGYSNFSRVLSLDVDYLKIDGSLIKNLDNDQNAKVIVETIVNFAKKINKKSIAEFVKDEKIFEECKKLGFDYFQGFYLEEPSPKFN